MPVALISVTSLSVILIMSSTSAWESLTALSTKITWLIGVLGFAEDGKACCTGESKLKVAVGIISLFSALVDTVALIVGDVISLAVAHVCSVLRIERESFAVEIGCSMKLLEVLLEFSVEIFVLHASREFVEVVLVS